MTGATGGRGLGEITRWVAVAIGLVLPLSTTLAEITTTTFLVCWLLSDSRRIRWAPRACGGALLASLGLFAFLAIGVTWSTAGWSAGFRCLLKYRELLYLPLLAMVFTEARWRVRGLGAFVTGASILLGLSYFEWLSGFDFGIGSSPHDYVTLMDRIIASIVTSLLGYVSLLEFLRRASHLRWLFLALACGALFNILFLLQGRTGYLLLAGLTLLLFAQHFGRRGVAAACLCIAVGGSGAFALSPPLRARITQSVSQIRHLLGAADQRTSDPRLEYYAHTLPLIGRHPLLGTGTGSFEREYTAFVAGTGAETTSDPHNEYLLLAVQLGVGGPLLFLVLLGTEWFAARQLPEREARILRGSVVAIGLGTLFNSLILSTTGGLIWSFLGGVSLGAWRDTPPDGQTLGDSSHSTAAVAPPDVSPHNHRPS